MPVEKAAVKILDPLGFLVGKEVFTPSSYREQGGTGLPLVHSQHALKPEVLKLYCRLLS